MKKQNSYTVTNEIKNFVMTSTKLFLIPKNNIIGYNHLMKAGVSKRAITSDVAHYLLLSDLNTICVALNKHLKVELSENKICALISYFHNKHIEPSPLVLCDINNNNFKLAAERLFQDKREPRETRALRALELKLWTNDNYKISNIKTLDSMIA